MSIELERNLDVCLLFFCYKSVHNVMFSYKEVMLASKEGHKEFKCIRVVYTHTRKNETLESMISRCKITTRPELTSCRKSDGKVHGMQLAQRMLLHEYLPDLPKGFQLTINITFIDTFYWHLKNQELRIKLREFGLPISVATKAELMVCLHEHKMSTDVAYREWHSVLRKWHYPIREEEGISLKKIYKILPGLKHIVESDASSSDEEEDEEEEDESFGSEDE